MAGMLLIVFLVGGGAPGDQDGGLAVWVPVAIVTGVVLGVLRWVKHGRPRS